MFNQLLDLTIIIFQVISVEVAHSNARAIDKFLRGVGYDAVDQISSKGVRRKPSLRKRNLQDCIYVKRLQTHTAYDTV